MKNIFITLGFIFGSICSFSQDTVRIYHKNYVTVFSKSKKYPVLVNWWVTKKLTDCPTPLKRRDNFKPDPKLPIESDLSKSYLNSGYDRGHMMPAADNLCQTEEILNECFYFTNMSAQKHSLNAGDWKSLETFTRDEASKYDSVQVWCGNIGELQKIGNVSVPQYCWKVIYIKKQNIWKCFLFENKEQKQDGFQNNEIPMKTITKMTGFKFQNL